MEMKTEYRIIGRFRKNEKPHVVDRDTKWTLSDAEHRLEELKSLSKREMDRKSRTPMNVGMISVCTPYSSEYDLLDLKIQERKVTSWSDSEG